jgi:hypothetical protein
MHVYRAFSVSIFEDSPGASFPPIARETPDLLAFCGFGPPILVPIFRTFHFSGVCSDLGMGRWLSGRGWQLEVAGTLRCGVDCGFVFVCVLKKHRRWAPDLLCFLQF